MSASEKAYKELLSEIYLKKVKGCIKCAGMNHSCGCNIAFSTIERIYKSRIPFRFRNARLSDFTVEVDEEPKKDVEKYINNIDEMKKRGLGLWISGGHSTGKTLLLCSILIKAIEAGYGSYYLDINDFYRLQEIRYNSEDDKYSNRMRLLQEVDFLAIDGLGLGVQGGKQASKEALADLIRDRVHAELPTHIASLGSDRNHLSQISQGLPDLVDLSCIPIELSGDDYIKDKTETNRGYFRGLK